MNKFEKHQCELEALYSKNQTIPRITEEFRKCTVFNFKEHMKKWGIDESFGFALLVQMALHKRCDMPTMVGLMRRYCASAQQCADWLLKAAEADLVDWVPALRVFVVKVEISDEVQADLDRFQYPLPMVVPPKTLTNNRQSGYLINNSSVILKDNHHEDDVCLDHINRMNRVRLCINQNTVTMVKNKWRNLDKPKQCESAEDFAKRKKAFEKYDRTAKDVITLLNKESDVIYLTHKFDKRGRTYAQGYHVNYQGAPWNKAVVEFADKEYIE